MLTADFFLIWLLRSLAVCKALETKLKEEEKKKKDKRQVAHETMIATIAGPSPLWTIVRLFALWKGMLVLVAAGSALVGPAYDTSASLLLAPASNSSSSMFLARLSSWDAVYFVQQAQRGYVFEQEWAFGEGLPRIITRALRGMFFFCFVCVCRCYSWFCPVPCHYYPHTRSWS